MILPLYTMGPTLQQFAKMHSGEIVRYGTILKNSNTGRIIGHIQETGLWQEALLEGSNPVLSIFNTVQNEQIKSRLNELQNTVGLVHNLQLLDLATSVVGIGVTVASTVIILNRLKELEKKTEEILSIVKTLPAIFQEGRLQDNLVWMQTYIARLEKAPSRSNSEEIVLKAEESLHLSFNHFSKMAQTMSSENIIDANLLRILLSAMATSAGAQYKAMLMLNEKKAAKNRVIDQYNSIEKLSWFLPPDVLRQKVEMENKETFQAISNDLNELLAQFACRTNAIEIMILRNINGRDFIEQARNENEEVLLFLPCSS